MNLNEDLVCVNIQNKIDQSSSKKYMYWEEEKNLLSKIYIVFIYLFSFS